MEQYKNQIALATGAMREYASRCKFLYNGCINTYDTFTCLLVQNQSNPIEQITITIMDSLSDSNIMIGHMCGISTSPLIPVSLKCALSATELKEDETLLALLRLTNADMKWIKQMNMFTATSMFG